MPEKIRVSEKALGHLSRGLYRSPASALRELVSNGWDANATEVRIDTAAPEFTQVAIQDNGEGFTKEQFVQLMSGGIGNSDKRPANIKLINGRPLIGRLGIGMLGIAQICGGFTITSKTASGKGFKARVVLYDLIRRKLDKDDPQIVSREQGGVEEVDVGEYTLLSDFDPDSCPVGTTVLADDVHPTFVQSFRDSYRQPPIQWSVLVRQCGKYHTLQELGDYWRLLWELAAACPVPYLTRDALPDRLVVDDQKRLEHYDFRVFVDSIELRKPVRLHGNRDGYTTRPIRSEEHRVFGNTVRFHGYVAVQEGLQLKPDELRGIMIRINEVGIGLYDPSLLNYRYNEGPRARWITGEVYVDEGVEDALNIDRDSFNRFHPEYRVLQRRLHEILQKEIFPKVYKQIDVRSDKRERSRKRERRKVLSRILSDTAARTAHLTQARAADTDAVETDIHAPDLLGVKKPYRELAAAILALFDVSMRERTLLDRRRVFAEGLLDLLSKW